MARRTHRAPEPSGGPGEGGAGGPGEPGALLPAPRPDGPAPPAPELEAVEDHAPDPPDPLNDSQPPGAPKSRPRKRRAGSRRGLRLPRRFKSKPGSAPGIEPADLAGLPSVPGAGVVACVDYSPDHVQFDTVADLPGFIAAHRPEWSVVRWINVAGLGDLSVIRAIAEKYHLHPLAIEDVLHVPQRPKVQAYEETERFQARLFIVARQIEMQDGVIHGEQVSVFVGHKTVLTFQENASDVFDAVRQRIRTAGSQLRRNDASFLAYSLLDAIVDACFPILEAFGDRLEDMEDEVLTRPSQDTIQAIHRIKRELLLVRRAMWPMREVLGRLQRDPHECFSEVTRTYVRDVYDHAVQLIDLIETYREVANGLTETYMTAISNRMNEVMKVLTIIGTIFIPLTFLAGVYGMNFRHLPELEWWWSYPTFWIVCLALAGGMVTWFRRRGWL
jgi:magnesium transporter